MLLRFQRYLASIPPVFLDGCIAVNIAVLATMSIYFATDEAAKYIDPAVRFWLLLAVGCSLQGSHALAKFRDRAYGKHMDEKVDDPKDAETIRKTIEMARALMEEDKRKEKQ